MCLVCVEETVAAVGVATALWPRVRAWFQHRRLNRNTRRVLHNSSLPNFLYMRGAK